MRQLLDSNGIQITNNAVYNAGQFSIGLHNTLSFYLVTDQNIKSVSCSSKVGKLLASYTEEGNFSFVGDAHNLEVFPIEQNGLKVFPIHLIYQNDKEQDFVDSISIDNISFNIQLSFVVQDQRLQVLLNNMGFVMDESWNWSLFTTDMKDGIDAIKLNQKRRELLLDFFTLTKLKGSYKALYEGIGFLEFEGRIQVYEYWYDKKNDKYILVSKEESKNINPDLYQKSKYLSLHYSINILDKNDPIGDDGMPNMVEEIIWDQEMFVKLCNLKNILQQYFLPDDVLIVDIAGEHISFGTHTIKYWPTQVNLFNNDELAKFSGIEIEKYNPDGDDELCPIFTHELLLDLDVYGITTDTEHPLVFKNGSAHSDKPAYRIISINPSDSTKDYEFATSIWSGDCAIVGIVIKNLPDYPYTYSYTLEQLVRGSWERVYLRDGFDKDTLDKDCKFAIRTAGTYRVVFYAFDNYGSMNHWEYEFYCNFPKFIPRIKLLSPKYLNEKQKVWNVRDLVFTQPYEISTLGYEFGARDLANQQYDVNDLGSETSKIIRKYISSKNDAIHSFTITQLRNIELSKLKNVPLSEYSDGYEVVLFDLNDIPKTGTFSLQIFESDEENAITYSNYIDLLSQLAAFNTTENLAHWYSFDIQLIQLRNGDVLGPTKPALILYAKERGTGFEDFKLLINDNEIQPIYRYNIIQYFSKGPSIRFFDTEENIVMVPASGDLVINYGIRDIVLKGTKISNCKDLYEAIKDLPELIVTYANGSVSLSSLQYDLLISHPSIGTRFEPYRKSPIELLYNAEQSKVIEPGTYIFAICDTDWKLDNYTIHWQIINTFSKEIVYDWIGYMLKWTSLESGVFDVKLEVEDKRTKEILTNTQIGCITVK